MKDWQEAIAYLGSEDFELFQRQARLMEMLNSVGTDTALAAINEWLEIRNLERSTGAYKLGHRDARHAAAELAAENDELHRDIMNLRIEEAAK